MSLIYKGQTISGGSGAGGGGVPKGTIVIWSGAADAIPSGWALCDGQNGTPDLRDRFVVGAGTSYEVGATGGEAEHTLTVDEMPVHSHILPSTGSVSGSAITYAGGMYGPGKVQQQPKTNVDGGSQPHNNLPPYYALCYIMKITDSGSGTDSGGSSEEVYSTEETMIGTWIDGKPLYRVALSTKNLPTNTGSTSSLYTFSEEVSIVYMLGAIDGVSDATYIVNGSVASYTLSQTTSYVLKYVPSAKTILMVGSNGEFANKEIRLIVAYTKNADEATS